MYDIVVSYSSSNRVEISYIRRLLEAAGFSVWSDELLEAGESYDRKIVKAINESKCVLVVWSQSAISSDWVKAEAKIALDQGKYIPILLAPATIPPPFSVLHTPNLQNWYGQPLHETWLSVIRSIRGKVDPSRKTTITTEKYETQSIRALGHHVHKLKARDANGAWAYYFVLVPPFREADFLIGLKSVDTIDLEDFGLVVARNFGETPSNETLHYLRSRFGFSC